MKARPSLVGHVREGRVMFFKSVWLYLPDRERGQ